MATEATKSGATQSSPFVELCASRRRRERGASEAASAAREHRLRLDAQDRSFAAANTRLWRGPILRPSQRRMPAPPFAAALRRPRARRGPITIAAREDKRPETCPAQGSPPNRAYSAACSPKWSLADYANALLEHQTG